MVADYTEYLSIVTYSYDASGSPVGFTYTDLTGYYEGGVPCNFLYRKNAQGDIIGIVDSSGNEFVKYTYDAWGNLISRTMHGSGLSSMHYNLAEDNPFLYRGYYFDRETGFYYLKSRYYDPAIGRFINADNYVSTGTGLLGYNMYAYCNNNPVMYVDPTGEAWYHWLIGGLIVVGAGVATVLTCGGFAAAATAVGLVGSGVAAATTTSTVAAGAFIGSATVYGTAALTAAMSSTSVGEFNSQGNWGTVAATTGGLVYGGLNGYSMSQASKPLNGSTGKGAQNPKVRAAAQRGIAMHKQMDDGPGVLKEQTIAPGCRVDGIDYANRIIYELKPNNPQAIAKGLAQLDRYTSAASQQFGGIWTGVLKLYD